jgi:phosphoserine aminotransferase
MTQIYNFAAGPAMLPKEVLQRVQDELFDWQGTGVSVMEIGHRTYEFQEMQANLEQKIRMVMSIPDNYKVLFLPGGAQGQFDAVPMNLAKKKQIANYFVTGVWSERAAKYAGKYVQVKIAAEASKNSIPDVNTWQIDPDAAYTYYCSNETINGIRFIHIPNTNTPLVLDMTSSILSEQIDVNKFGIIFASAQKNLGISGITLVIVRDDLLDQSLNIVPEVLNYAVQTKNNSGINTIPTFPVYMMDLMVDWVIANGGVAKMAQNSLQKSNKVYQCIDQSNGFYTNVVEKPYRSLINVPFDLSTPELLKLFLNESKQEGLAYLQGHKLGGGARASIYNAMPETGVDKLVAFMQHFMIKYA